MGVRQREVGGSRVVILGCSYTDAKLKFSNSDPQPYPKKKKYANFFLSSTIIKKSGAHSRVATLIQPCFQEKNGMVLSEVGQRPVNIRGGVYKVPVSMTCQ